jgi:hypothetical protein
MLELLLTLGADTTMPLTEGESSSTSTDTTATTTTPAVILAATLGRTDAVSVLLKYSRLTGAGMVSLPVLAVVLFSSFSLRVLAIVDVANLKRIQQEVD